jgi:hypothetical protein
MLPALQLVYIKCTINLMNKLSQYQSNIFKKFTIIIIILLLKRILIFFLQSIIILISQNVLFKTLQIFENLLLNFSIDIYYFIS